MISRFILRTLVGWSFLFFFPFFAWAEPLSNAYDHSLWDQFLKKYVQKNGSFDYAGAKKDSSLLESYEAKLRKLKVPDGWPREESIALLINVYHMGVVRSILRHYPLKSLESLTGVWDIQDIRIGKGRYSLNQIRLSQLMGIYRDEKINTALACGAKSCPKWIPEAYTAPRVEGLLYQAAIRFVNDPSFHKIELGKKKIFLSRILKWYSKDFRLDFGAFENDRGWPDDVFAVVSFMSNYLEDEEKIAYLEESSFKVDYLPFDWTLYDSSGMPAAARN